MDSSKVRALGWKPEISLTHGVTLAYGHFLREQARPPLPVA